MAIVKPVKSQQSYNVICAAKVENDGPTLLTVLWIPRDDADVPEPKTIKITPGSTGSISGVTPAFESANSLEVRATLPDGGRAKLTLESDGVVLKDASISKNVKWTAAVEK